MNFLANQEPYLRGVEYLKGQIIKNGYKWETARMKPMDGTLYINKAIEVGGTQQLLTGATTKERGITNFDGNKLVKERVFVVNAIAFGARVANKNTPAHSVNFQFNTVPAYLMNANLVLKQKDEKIINLPISAIVNGRVDSTMYRQLDALALIEDEAIIDYEIEFPQGVDAGLGVDDKLFVSVYLRGLETYLKR